MLFKQPFHLYEEKLPPATTKGWHACVVSLLLISIPIQILPFIRAFI